MADFKKLENHISKTIGRAIADNALIQARDKILVGVSGGKDSLALLRMLMQRSKWVPVKYEVVACHILTNNRCAGCREVDVLKRYFDDLECPSLFEKSEIVDEAKDFSCFWCAWNRRKALFKLAEREGVTKIALGHHMDDLVETTLMNLFFHGEISSMNAKQTLFKGKITLIRPMVYLEEKKIAEYAKMARFPRLYCTCPHADTSRRTQIKHLVKDLEKECRYIKKNIMNAPYRIKKEYLGVKHDS